MDTALPTNYGQQPHWKRLGFLFYVHKPFNISGYLTTTSATAKGNEGWFSGTKSLKCNARWTPAVHYPAWDTGFCSSSALCSVHLTFHLLIQPPCDHCFLLIYVGNNFITTVCTKKPHKIGDPAVKAMVTHIHFLVCVHQRDQQEIHLMNTFIMNLNSKRCYSYHCLCLTHNGIVKEQILTQYVFFNTFLGSSIHKHNDEKTVTFQMTIQFQFQASQGAVTNSREKLQEVLWHL